MRCKEGTPRTKYDIIGFSFTCLHECHEYKWDICKHCRSRNRCIDHIRFVYPSEEGICFPTEEIELSPQHSQDLGTYIHEFTEASIIQIFVRWRKNWNSEFESKKWNIKHTYIVHVLSPFGTNNQKCLEPSTRRNRPKW